MNQPERIEPESNDPSAGSSAGAEWLVGAEEGVDAELVRREHLSRVMPVPKLFRPGQDGVAEPPVTPAQAPVPLSLVPAPAAAASATSAPAPVPHEFPAPESRPTEPCSPAARPQAANSDEFIRGNPMTWEAAPSSVPTIRREVAPRSIPQVENVRAFPMDDAEERARVRAEAQDLAAWSAEQSVRPHTIVAPDAFELADVALPWWMHIPAQIKTDRRLQILLGVAVVALIVIANWPRGPQPEPLGNITKHPDKYDGHIVTVAGRVGDVFEVGGGHAYYLMQNKDTLVVFTRGVAPRRRDKLTLSGTVSTGYLDGEPHLALFELSKD